MAQNRYCIPQQFKAETGKITGLLGRNGGGKSTLFRVLFGLEPCDEGIFSVNGSVVKKTGLYSVPKLIHFLPQGCFLPQFFKVSTVLKHFKVEARHILVDFPELEGDVSKQVSALSGGMERLWSVLTMIYTPGKFVLLDEPFSHIMPLYVERLMAILKREKHRKGFIVTDHLYEHVLSMCDQLYLMKEGRTIYVKDEDDLVLHGYVNR